MRRSLQWHWRLAHTHCFVDQLAWIARGRKRRKLCVLPNYHQDEAMFRDTLKILATLFHQRNKCAFLGLAAVRESPRTQDKAERLIVSFVVALLHEPGAGAA